MGDLDGPSINKRPEFSRDRPYTENGRFPISLSLLSSWGPMSPGGGDANEPTRNKSSASFIFPLTIYLIVCILIYNNPGGQEDGKKESQYDAGAGSDRAA